MKDDDFIGRYQRGINIIEEREERLKREYCNNPKVICYGKKCCKGKRK